MLQTKDNALTYIWFELSSLSSWGMDSHLTDKCPKVGEVFKDSDCQSDWRHVGIPGWWDTMDAEIMTESTWPELHGQVGTSWQCLHGASIRLTLGFDKTLLIQRVSTHGTFGVTDFANKFFISRLSDSSPPGQSSDHRVRQCGCCHTT